ncbi:hypothetical protein SS1G_00984 [Sclerotinia sclerotiorum 1980 UF-70]|uniref:Uncharacterized protein n=1 Tax=Sclerotinia sclerotiorum (strain ATCC 18683 / 1980 / Ss-1) TaxID=665079 RepID=A7E6Q9_SCLS1|nr:hypothetical protein SS1G_00984 [Sclerotinia sclerotiorum 1980 UF-70]EDN91581.1 hypothetical protein SS1G_00984 [Sclerotinia sclerotiorum 1980 UF-70]
MSPTKEAPQDSLVLESRPANDTWLSRNPLISSDPTISAFGATRWKCEPMKYCDDRRSGVIRGEVLGGTSRINIMGFIPAPDCNARDAPPEGVATLSLTLSERRERVSSFEAFLSKEIALERQNLTICTNTLVSRILFRHDKGLPRTEKVLFKSMDPTSDRIFLTKVDKEVITDHISIPVAWEVPAAKSLTSMAIRPFRIALELLKYIFFRTTFHKCYG